MAVVVVKIVEGLRVEESDVEKLREPDDEVDEVATALSLSGDGSSKVSLLGLLQFLFPKFSGAQHAHKSVV